MLLMFGWFCLLITLIICSKEGSILFELISLSYRLFHSTTYWVKSMLLVSLRYSQIKHSGSHSWEHYRADGCDIIWCELKNYGFNMRSNTFCLLFVNIHGWFNLSAIIFLIIDLFCSQQWPSRDADRELKHNRDCLRELLTGLFPPRL